MTFTEVEKSIPQFGTHIHETISISLFMQCREV